MTGPLDEPEAPLMVSRRRQTTMRAARYAAAARDRLSIVNALAWINLGMLGLNALLTWMLLAKR